MNELNQRILQTCNARMSQIKGNLEYEESNRKIAKLQGELRGISFFLGQYNDHMPAIEKVFPESLINNTGYPKEATSLNRLELDELDHLIDLKERDPNWAKVDEAVKGEIIRQKDYLFHHAEKSRDLDYVHGKRDGLLLYDNVISGIIDELKDVKENYPLFNEDDDHDDRTPKGTGLKLISNGPTQESEEDQEDSDSYEVVIEDDDFYDEDDPGIAAGN